MKQPEVKEGSYFHRNAENQLDDQQPTPRGLKRDQTGMLSADFNKHKLEKIVVGGKGKRKYPTRRLKVCAENYVKHLTFYKFCSVTLYMDLFFKEYQSQKQD
jgi:hypothetical protein